MMYNLVVISKDGRQELLCDDVKSCIDEIVECYDKNMDNHYTRWCIEGVVSLEGEWTVFETDYAARIEQVFE